MLALQQQLQTTQWLGEEELRQLQLTQLSPLLAHAIETAPYYRQHAKLRSHKKFRKLDAELFREWPILKRADIQDAGESLLSEKSPSDHGKLKQIQTSGSTGSPITAYKTELNSFFFHGLTLRDHLWHKRDFSARFAAIRPEVKSPPGKGTKSPTWGRAVNSVFESGPSFGLNVRTEIEQQASWLEQINPDYLLSLPTNIRALGKHFRDTGKTLPNLREIRSYGEVASDEARETCKDVFGVPMIDAYSSQEVGYIALQCPDHDHYHIQSETVYVEVLDENDKPCSAGETGRLIVTPLQNFAMPLIRYELGDYVELGDPCDCGRGLPVIRRIHGRERNMLALPDGHMSYPSFPAELWTAIAPVRQFQLIQQDLENMYEDFISRVEKT